MSYITSTLKCKNCAYEMNVAFGISGNTLIADHPTECPKCKSKLLEKISDGWNATKPRTCELCGKEMKERFDTIAKKFTGHLWYCECSPDLTLSIG